MPYGVEKKHHAHDASKWSHFSKFMFSSSQDHLHYQQMEQFCLTAQVNHSSLRFQVHQTVLHHHRRRRVPLQLGQHNNPPWYRNHRPFTFRLSPSQLILNFFTSHHSCLTDPSDHHIQLHLTSFLNNSKWITLDFHQHRLEIHQAHHQTINPHRITKSIHQLNSIQRMNIHRTRRPRIQTMNRLMW